MILLIDNYDSFTYNLYQYLAMLGEELKVVRNDQLTALEVAALRPEIIVLSPGPCTPDETGICRDVLALLGTRVPILGICLGHQTIASHFGARIIQACEPVHGKVHPIHHDGKGIFEGLPDPIRVTRYHSLTVDPTHIPACLEVTAWTENGTIMGLRHRTLPIAGVQFHPEALLTEHGLEMMRQFLVQARRRSRHV